MAPVTSPVNRPAYPAKLLAPATTPSTAATRSSSSNSRLLVLASAVLVALCYNAALARASPVLFQQAPDTSTKEDAPTGTVPGMAGDGCETRESNLFHPI